MRFGGRVFLRAVYVPGLGVLLLVFHGALVRFPALHLVLLVELKHYVPEDRPGKKKKGTSVVHQNMLAMHRTEPIGCVALGSSTKSYIGQYGTGASRDFDNALLRRESGKCKHAASQSRSNLVELAV